MDQSSDILFKPKIFITLKDYNGRTFLNDLFAGIIVGIVALPLAIAFAKASGVTPQSGLITAIVAGFLISFLGGSRVQIGGPTGAFVAIVYGVVTQQGVDGLIISTFMAGIILLILGVIRVGAWIRYIPTSVVTGFTTGIAMIIFSSQIPDFFGLRLESLPDNFIDQWRTYLYYLKDTQIYSLGIAAGTILVTVGVTKLYPRIPSAFLALVISTLIVKFFHLPIPTIGDQFGNITFDISQWGLPHLEWSRISQLVPCAVSIAALGAIESLLCAVVADGMIGSHHRSNTELIAQGVANMASACFGGMPATGAIARTATNVRNGGRTPVAGIIHALTLLLMVVFFGPWTVYIPLATLAGILIVVAYNMSEWRHFVSLSKTSHSDALILMTTFLLTISLGLVAAIQVGMVLAMFVFMAKMAKASQISIYSTGKMTDKYAPIDSYYSRPQGLSQYEIPANTIVYEIRGAFFFGAAVKFETTLLKNTQNTKWVILRLNQLYLLDSTGITTLKNIIEQLHKRSIQVLIAEANVECFQAMQAGNLVEVIGNSHFYPTLEMAITQIRHHQ